MEHSHLDQVVVEDRPLSVNLDIEMMDALLTHFPPCKENASVIEDALKVKKWEYVESNIFSRICIMLSNSEEDMYNWENSLVWAEERIESRGSWSEKGEVVVGKSEKQREPPEVLKEHSRVGYGPFDTETRRVQ